MIKMPIRYIFNLNKFLLASCKILSVASTDKLSLGNSNSLSPKRIRRGLKNSSAHDGDKVKTPEKSISKFSVSFKFFKVDWNAKNDSLPAG